jgi:hypothetical protein
LSKGEIKIREAFPLFEKEGPGEIFETSRIHVEELRWV